eukprot:g11043.t1
MGGAGRTRSKVKNDLKTVFDTGIKHITVSTTNSEDTVALLASLGLLDSDATLTRIVEQESRKLVEEALGLNVDEVTRKGNVITTKSKGDFNKFDQKNGGTKILKKLQSKLVESANTLSRLEKRAGLRRKLSSTTSAIIALHAGVILAPVAIPAAVVVGAGAGITATQIAQHTHSVEGDTSMIEADEYVKQYQKECGDTTVQFQAGSIKVILGAIPPAAWIILAIGAFVIAMGIYNMFCRTIRVRYRYEGEGGVGVEADLDPPPNDSCWWCNVQ